VKEQGGGVQWKNKKGSTEEMVFHLTKTESGEGAVRIKTEGEGAIDIYAKRGEEHLKNA